MSDLNGVVKLLDLVNEFLLRNQVKLFSLSLYGLQKFTIIDLGLINTREKIFDDVFEQW